MRLTISSGAKPDLRLISRDIANESPNAARRWLIQTKARIDRRRETPHLGVARDDGRPGLRLLILGDDLVSHRLRESNVDIVRIVHSAREWQDLI